jgi:AraC family transcriptional activator of pobA
MENRNVSAPSLPTYLLYAEEAGPASLDVVHWESIAHRSALHSWEIKPHRHASLLQVLLLEKSDAVVSLDGSSFQVDAPALITVMPLVAHSFKFNPRVEGSVLTLDASHVRDLLSRDQGLLEALQQSRVHGLTDLQHGQVSLALDSVRRAYASHARWRETAIDASLLTLLVEVCRVMPPPLRVAARQDRAGSHVARLLALVDAQYRRHPNVIQIANEMGITTVQLNRICRQVLGKSALEVIHARLLLEAQRELHYTTMSVKQIAFNLGFSNPGYFTRFFLRATGATPTRWRQRSNP